MGENSTFAAGKVKSIISKYSSNSVKLVPALSDWDGGNVVKVVTRKGKWEQWGYAVLYNIYLFGTFSLENPSPERKLARKIIERNGGSNLGKWTSLSRMS